MDTYGTSLVGLPGITIGFNDRLGWTHTVNTYDGADLYTLEIEQGKYRFGDELRAFDSHSETILVKENNGKLREEILTIRSSIHGPVVAENNERAVAVRVAGLDKTDMVGQWWEMARATSIEGFETALSRLQIPMFNVLYADADGHIFYLFNANVPKRSFGDVATWDGAIDGSDPSTLWQSYLPYEKLPRILDPANGWLQNANDPPWTTTIPQTLSPKDFPAYLSPVHMASRPQRSAKMLLNDESITFEEAIAYKHNTRVEIADRVLDDLLALVDTSNNVRAKQAAKVLSAWDRHVNAQSKGALLFEVWLEDWIDQPVNWLIPWSEKSPTSTPSGISDANVAVTLLAKAADKVQTKYGALDIPWGDIHRARRNGKDVAVSGASGDPMGVFSVAGFIEVEDNKRMALFGDTYYTVTEFTPEGVRAKVLTAYGNSTQPHSSHNGDQLELYSQQKMRTVWKKRADVEAHTKTLTKLK